MSGMLAAWVGIGLLFVASSLQAQDSSLADRFLMLSRELRSHRAEMLGRFDQESFQAQPTSKRGLRIYFRWAPSGRERLRNIRMQLESGASVGAESLAIREERSWGLWWYSVLLPKPAHEISVLKVSADVEFQHQRTPFHSTKELQSFEGTLALSTSKIGESLRLVIGLEADSPFTTNARHERSLLLSLVPESPPERNNL